jgi:catechol 2,3-dioxygenase-like lactoylglutathione lyase family enzyme
MSTNALLLPAGLRPRPDPHRGILFVVLLGTILLLASLATAAEQSPATKPSAIASAVVRVGMNVDDMDRSLAFYTSVLDFKKISDDEVAGADLERFTGIFGARCRIVRLRLGDEELELTEYLASRGREIPRDSRSNDLWFQHVAIIVSDMDTAFQRLRKHKVRFASTGPQRLPDWNPNAGGIQAFYFHDPDGHVLEILQFPQGKGDPKWRTAAQAAESGHPFLGIDHTAIVVSDTRKSLAFYVDTLGMRIAGNSENWGDEQEHLNNVAGARLRITTLHADAGPGIEFLEYVNPRTGRSIPADTAANDLAYWSTVVSTTDASATHRRTHSSSAVTRLPDGEGNGYEVRDPDGHALRIVEKAQPATRRP